MNSDQFQATISRREVLRLIGAGCAGLLTASALAGASGCGRKPAAVAARGRILSENQMQLLRAFADVIIPETATPGAVAADVHGFVDDQLANCQSPVEAAQFIRELESAGALVQQQWGAEYWKLSEEARIDTMTALSTATAPFEKLGAGFFDKLKRLTMFGYYSSEVGATEELVYLPVPGGYDGDFKVSSNGGKAFSPHTF